MCGISILLYYYYIIMIVTVIVTAIVLTIPPIIFASKKITQFCCKTKPDEVDNDNDNLSIPDSLPSLISIDRYNHFMADPKRQYQRRLLDFD